MLFLSIFALLGICTVDILAASTSPRALRREMADALPDIERVDEILGHYAKLKSQHVLSKKTKKAFEQWLCQKSLFLGSKFYDHKLIYKKFRHLAKNKKFKSAYTAFVKSIASPHKPKALRSSQTAKKIAILYTGSYGGGHKMPALALATNFEKQGHLVQLIDVDAISDRYSPVIEGYRRGQIYQEVFQKLGNAKKAHTLGKRIDDAQRTSQKKYLGDIRNMIADYGADHIFAVAHHRPMLSYLSFYLGIPMTYIHTDYSFHNKLVPILKEQMKLKRRPITFAALTKDRSFFEKVYRGLKIKKGRLPFATRRQIVHLGFPVRSSFTPVSKEQVASIRDSLSIPRDAIVCKLAMGQNGLSREIKTILKQVIREENKLSKPLHIFVICGKNDELKIEIQQLVDRTLTENSHIVVHVLGFQNEQEMAQIDKASDVWITKPGGSTCAELIKTQKQMLYVLNPHHTWERVNASYLEHIKLGGHFSPKKSIIKQIEARIRADKKLNHTRLPKNHWARKSTQLLYKEV